MKVSELKNKQILVLDAKNSIRLFNSFYEHWYSLDGTIGKCKIIAKFSHLEDLKEYLNENQINTSNL